MVCGNTDSTVSVTHLLFALLQSSSINPPRRRISPLCISEAGHRSVLSKMGNPLIHRRDTIEKKYVNCDTDDSIRSMGLTPLAGLPGATRCGDVDPS